MTINDICKYFTAEKAILPKNNESSMKNSNDVETAVQWASGTAIKSIDYRLFMELSISTLQGIA